MEPIDPVKPKGIIFVLLILADARLADAQTSVPPGNYAAQIDRRMFVDPSSTNVSLGKVSLTVNPLTHKGMYYLGGYQIKVVPYYFKNEAGTLKMEASEDSVQKLAQGIKMKFTGKATNTKTGLQKSITGIATPSTNNRGSAVFTVITEHGLMVFNTTYHLGE
jgi:hypothetical protein